MLIRPSRVLRLTHLKSGYAKFKRAALREDSMHEQHLNNDIRKECQRTKETQKTLPLGTNHHFIF